MRTTTLVQASADVITVVNLKAGDVYKRLEKDYASNYDLKFGVVQDVLHNGEDAVITALEFTSSYGGVEPKLKTFGTDSDLKLFAAQPDEVREHFTELLEASRRAVRKAEDELTKQVELAAQIARLTENASAAALTAPEIAVQAARA